MRIILPLLLIVGGGISNSVDRIRLGYVRDPLVLGNLQFNIADIAIALGIILAIYTIYKQENRV